MIADEDQTPFSDACFLALKGYPVLQFADAGRVTDDDLARATCDPIELAKANAIRPGAMWGVRGLHDDQLLILKGTADDFSILHERARNVLPVTWSLARTRAKHQWRLYVRRKRHELSPCVNMEGTNLQVVPWCPLRFCRYGGGVVYWSHDPVTTPLRHLPDNAYECLPRKDGAGPATPESASDVPDWLRNFQAYSPEEE